MLLFLLFSVRSVFCFGAVYFPQKKRKNLSGGDLIFPAERKFSPDLPHGAEETDTMRL